MSITTIQRDVNNNVAWVKVTTTDTLSTVQQTGYVASQMPIILALNNGQWEWYLTDWIALSASDGNALFYFTDTTFATWTIYNGQSSGTVDPGLENQVAHYAANGSVVSGFTISDENVLGTDSAGNLISIPYAANDNTGPIIGGSDSLVYRDANGTYTINNYAIGKAYNNTFIDITLNASSPKLQNFSGLGNVNCFLPDATTIPVELTYELNNESTGNITVKNNSGGTIVVIPPGGYLVVRVIVTTTPGGTWEYNWGIPSNGQLGQYLGSDADSIPTWNDPVSLAGDPPGGVSNVVGRDANGLTAVRNLLLYEEFHTLPGTIQLSVSSGRYQNFDGGGSGTCVMPDATTLTPSIFYELINNAGGNLTVNTFTGATLATVSPGGYLLVRVLETSTSDGSWEFYWGMPSSPVNSVLTLNANGVPTPLAILTGTNGGTGVNNGTNTITYAGNVNFANSFTTIGNFSVIQRYSGATDVTFPTSGTLATTSQIPTGAALTKTDDTNVTLTLGGSPNTALVNAASLTLGWTGLLSGTRGGTGVNNGSNTATYAGNLNFAGSFTTSGAFAVTQTYTGVTNVTFPTSGTLATTAQLLSSPLTTKGDLWGFSTTNARVPVGSTNGQILQVNSGAAAGLSYSTPTYPSASGSNGTILRSNGTNNVYSTSTFADTYTANNILFASAANTVTGLATANNGVLITSAGGVPSISSTLPSAVQSNITQVGTLGSLTVTGNINNTALTASQVVTTDGSKNLTSTPSTSVGTWVLIQTQDAANSSTIDFTSGLTTYTNYKVEYSGLLPGTNNVVLQMLISTNGGSSYLTTGYKAGLQVIAHNSASWSNSNSTTSYLLSGNYSSVLSDSGAGTVYLYNIASVNQRVWGHALVVNSSNPFYEIACGLNTVGANAIRFLFSSGFIATGKFSLYGLVQ